MITVEELMLWFALPKERPKTAMSQPTTQKWVRKTPPQQKPPGLIRGELV